MTVRASRRPRRGRPRGASPTGASRPPPSGFRGRVDEAAAHGGRPLAAAVAALARRGAPEAAAGARRDGDESDGAKKSSTRTSKPSLTSGARGAAPAAPAAAARKATARASAALGEAAGGRGGGRRPFRRCLGAPRGPRPSRRRGGRLELLEEADEGRRVEGAAVARGEGPRRDLWPRRRKATPRAAAAPVGIVEQRRRGVRGVGEGEAGPRAPRR